MIEIKTNANEAAATLEAMAKRIQEQISVLLNDLGRSLVKDTQDRILTADGNSWAGPSKWVRAKKDVTRALEGAEKFVFWRVNGMRMELFGETRGINVFGRFKGGSQPWTITQHHEGFVNDLADPAEIEDGKVRIDVVNPGPLGLKKAGPFYFLAKVAGQTPARKIWPNQDDATKIANPVAFRWLQKVINETSGVRP